MLEVRYLTNPTLQCSVETCADMGRLVIGAPVCVRLCDQHHRMVAGEDADEIRRVLRLPDEPWPGEWEADA